MLKCSWRTSVLQSSALIPLQQAPTGGSMHFKADDETTLSFGITVPDRTQGKPSWHQDLNRNRPR